MPIDPRRARLVKNTVKVFQAAVCFAFVAWITWFLVFFVHCLYPAPNPRRYVWFTMIGLLSIHNLLAWIKLLVLLWRKNDAKTTTNR